MMKMIFVDDENPNFQSINGVLYSKDGESLVRYPQEKNDSTFIVPDGVTDVCEKAFEGCSQLDEVTISDGVRFIGAFAFNKCAVKEVRFPPSYNWLLTSYIDNAPLHVGWLSADCLQDAKIAAKYLCEKYAGYMWISMRETPDDPEIKNLE